MRNARRKKNREAGGVTLRFRIRRYLTATVAIDPSRISLPPENKTVSIAWRLPAAAATTAAATGQEQSPVTPACFQACRWGSGALVSGQDYLLMGHVTVRCGRNGARRKVKLTLDDRSVVELWKNTWTYHLQVSNNLLILRAITSSTTDSVEHPCVSR